MSRDLRTTGVSLVSVPSIPSMPSLQCDAGASMTTFFFDKTKIELPAVQISPPEATSYRDAWLHETHITIRLSAAVEGFRVHTNGVNFPTGSQFGKMVAPRAASNAAGRWVFIGDGAISTSSEIVSIFSLPGPFSHVSKAVLPASCIVNLGLCKPLFGGAGGGIQVEYVGGPSIQFEQMKENVWHHAVGSA
jgi:hypothetical protein